jgi:hypothetical protein
MIIGSLGSVDVVTVEPNSYCGKVESYDVLICLPKKVDKFGDVRVDDLWGEDRATLAGAKAFAERCVRSWIKRAKLLDIPRP